MLLFFVISVNGFSQVAVPEKLSLAEAVSFAMKSSPTLRAARAEFDAAKAETGAARSKTRPQLSLNSFATKSNMPNILQTAMGVEPQAQILAPEGKFLDANLMLMAPIYTGGLLSGIVAASVAREKEAFDELSGMRAEVALMVRESYLRALYGAELVKAQRARMEAAEAMVGVAKAQLDAGKGIEAFVRRAEAELAEAKQEFTMAENDRRKMILDLLAEMGAALDSRVSLIEEPAFRAFEGTLEANLGSAKQNRGELLAMRQRVRAAQAELTSAKGALHPQIYGFAMGDSFSPRDMEGRNSGYTVGLALSLPVFDGGMRRSEIAKSRAMLEKAKADVERMEIRTAKEVRQAWLDIETAESIYQSSRLALVAAKAANDVVAIRVESGKAIQLEQLDALATLTRARANLAKSNYEQQLAIARLDRAVGRADSNESGGNQK